MISPDDFPIALDKLREACQVSWDAILTDSVIGGRIRVGDAFTPSPQLMGHFLHLLIPVVLREQNGVDWREGVGNEKDVVYEPDNLFSFEIKTSSSPKGVFGNRSYATESNHEKKSKVGFLLTLNFPPCGTKRDLLVRFGWVTQSDWIAQKSFTGQQARLSKEALASLRTL
jgi:hypothetical protein